MSKPKKAPAALKVYDREAVFVGRRVCSDGSTAWKFELLPDRKPMLFGRIKGVWIGYTYKCTDKSISGSPERTEREREKNPKWEAADALVDAKNARERAEREISKLSKKNLTAAIEAIRPLCRGLDYGELTKLITYLVTEGSKRK